MRVLHFGDDHERLRAAEDECESDRRADQRIHARQCLPVRNLSAHRGRDSTGFADDESVGEGGRAMNKTLTTDFIPGSNTVLEPERYELQTPPVHHFKIDR